MMVSGLLVVSLLGAGPATAECVPACRSGFVCVGGACLSACNPSCAAGEQCTSQGECLRGESTGQAPASLVPSTMSREQILRELKQQRELLPSTAGPKTLMWIGLPILSLGVIGLGIDGVFLATGTHLEGGFLIGIVVVAAFLVIGAIMTTVGIIQLAARAPERAAVESRIDELNEMLRGAPGQSAAPPPLWQGEVTIARF